MALTWATGVRLGRATRRFERENELHLAASLRRFGSSSGPRNAYFYYLFAFLCFLSYFGLFVLDRVFGPLSFLGPFRISVFIYMLLKLMRRLELNFEKTVFSLQIPWPLGLQFGGWGRNTRVFVESTCNLHFAVSRAASNMNSKTLTTSHCFNLNNQY
ncbi:hypothetical protein Hanom_Chr08g00721111 [Helianthus anomalus]